MFTYDGHGFPVAQHLVQEGCEVTIAQIMEESELYDVKEKEDPFDKERRLALFSGIFDKKPAKEVLEKMKSIKNPQEYFIIFDLNTLYRYADQIRDMGFHGNFVTEEDYQFEADRDKAKEFVKKYYPKMVIPEKKEFTRISDAKKFLEKTDEVWVLKSYDDSANAFVPNIDDPELSAGQLIHIMEAHPEQYEGIGFLLELFIPSIIEITPEKLYYDGVPLATTVNFENKPLGSGNLSIPTGCAADLVFPVDLESRINKIAFPEKIDEMAKAHKGLFIWDASILINKRDGKMYFGEFCSNRFGYNSFFTELAQLPSVDYFFTSLVQQKNPFTIGTVGTSIRIFNLQRDNDRQVADGISIDYKLDYQKDVWLWDAMKKGKKVVSVGESTNLAVVTGSGKSINEAVNRMYKAVESFSFVGAYYRPRADYVSLGYPTSIFNRLNYGLYRGLYQLPFNVKVGDI